MADNHFDQVMVWDRLGTSVRIKPYGTASVVDPVTGAPVTVTQGGQSVTLVTADENGHASFVAQQGIVKLVDGGLVQTLVSSEAATAGAANVAAAQAAQQGAETAETNAGNSAAAAKTSEDNAAASAASASSAAAAAVQPLSDQQTQLMDVAATINDIELTQRVDGIWAGTTWGKSTAVSVAVDLWSPQIPVKVTSISYIWHQFSLAASNTDYWTMQLRRLTTDGLSHTIAEFTTQSSGGLGITTDVAWTMLNVPFDPVHQFIAAGESMSVGILKNGNPVAMGFPFVVTWGYQPGVVPA